MADFKYAAANKLRFPYKGLISVEDLFDLSLDNLDTIYKALSKQIKSTKEESLMQTASKEDEELNIKLDIVKEIFTDKQTAIEARKTAAAKKAKQQKIMAIIDAKENAALNDMSIDELKAMLAED